MNAAALCSNHINNFIGPSHITWKIILNFKKTLEWLSHEAFPILCIASWMLLLNNLMLTIKQNFLVRHIFHNAMKVLWLSQWNIHVFKIKNALNCVTDTKTLRKNGDWHSNFYDTRHCNEHLQLIVEVLQNEIFWVTWKKLNLNFSIFFIE